ncbi:hypothetical protein OJAV_G00017130 [Oryzias javanicus]|uniref:Uncharacterized protein n=1 Tax=Oryzias javanicus TaxID=123683 RepID=A0A437DK58_ORYJA|nr:hypothetical protein OJAV_G00017130 [Oryzias javanicus]
MSGSDSSAVQLSGNKPWPLIGRGRDAQADCQFQSYDLSSSSYNAKREVERSGRRSPRSPTPFAVNRSLRFSRI